MAAPRSPESIAELDWGFFIKSAFSHERKYSPSLGIFGIPEGKHRFARKDAFGKRPGFHRFFVHDFALDNGEQGRAAARGQGFGFVERREMPSGKPLPQGLHEFLNPEVLEGDPAAGKACRVGFRHDEDVAETLCHNVAHKENEKKDRNRRRGQKCDSIAAGFPLSFVQAFIVDAVHSYTSRRLPTMRRESMFSPIVMTKRVAAIAKRLL